MIGSIKKENERRRKNCNEKMESGFYQQHYQFYYYRETYPFMRQKTYLQHEPILIEVKSLELLWL